MAIPTGRADHPLFDPKQRIKLGIFGSNVSNGCTISTRRVVVPADLGAEPRSGAAGRGVGLRPAGAGRALEGLWRHHRFQRRLPGGLHLGRGAGGAHRAHSHLRHLARADRAPDLRRQAGGDHRPHQQRPLRHQRGVRLVHAGDGDVRRPAIAARRPLRARHRVDSGLQAPVAGAGLRLRGRVLHASRAATCCPSRCSSPIRC